MNRFHPYLIALGVFQVFLFLHFSAIINAGPGISMMTQGGFDAYLSIALFALGFALIFYNLASIAQVMTHEGGETDLDALRRVFRRSVGALVVLLALEFIQAFILLNPPAY
jgi:hypothetical protein